MRTGLDKTRAVIVATAVLHNVAINMKVNLPQPEPELHRNEMVAEEQRAGDDGVRRLLIENYFARLT